jgi:hypothetical protein
MTTLKGKRQKAIVTFATLLTLIALVALIREGARRPTVVRLFPDS